MQNRNSDRSLANELLVLVLLVSFGVALRVYFRNLPNFAPVAGLALFAGYYFRRVAIAIVVPVLVMVISDQVIGGYHWQLMLVVYAMLVLPVAFRSLLRSKLEFGSETNRKAITSAATVMGCSLVASLLFFAVTNLAVWQFSALYEKSLLGLATCYAQAIPFFRYTLAGDLMFSAVLFAGYALAVRRAEAPQLGMTH